MEDKKGVKGGKGRELSNLEAETSLAWICSQESMLPERVKCSVAKNREGKEKSIDNNTFHNNQKYSRQKELQGFDS